MAFICVLLIFTSCSIAPPDTADTNDSGNHDNSPPVNEAPVAIAGPDQTALITEAENISLDGTGSYDPEERELTYYWHCSDGAATFPLGNTIATPTVMLPGSGIFVIALVVDDGTKQSEPDFLTITVVEPDARVDSELTQDAPSQNQYRTIQAAVDAVADGTDKLIAVDHGPYEEQVNVAEGIRLFGIKQLDGLRPLIHYAAPDSESVVKLQSNAVLDSLRIQCDSTAGDATLKTAVSVEGSFAEITRCRIIDTQSDGIVVKAQGSVEVAETVLEDVSGEGIVAESNTTVLVRDTRLIQIAGSAIWIMGGDYVELTNLVIYRSGWHGIDLQDCTAIMVDHCSIVNFSKNDSSQAGLKVTNGGQVEITNNLFVIQNLDTLIGVQVTGTSTPEFLDYEYNYVFSNQSIPNYYAGELSLANVTESNVPNATEQTTQDPLLTDPAGGDFRLLTASPAAGMAEGGEDCGAQGNVLIP